ncbi:MAG TPA: CPBP family intramembrane glutamic endopeptidase [Candidatus Thermoplasmatota archaeon]|nr:CPBP family intramembrane glutamic endopeptidase [Candidatus Thermoplasmatota archaeon]
MTPLELYYLLEPLVPAWFIGFGLLLSRPHWTWRQAVGVALILYPIVDMALGLYYGLQVLAANPVLQPIPAERLWRLVYTSFLYELAVPLVGFLLFFDAHRQLAPGPRQGLQGLVPQVSDGAGLWQARSLWQDALLGSAFLVPLGLAYGGAYQIAKVLSPGAGTGNEAVLFQNLTPLLVLLLSLAAGITEEFLFRGVMLRHLSERMPFLAAAVLQAAFFGLVHAGYGNWSHVLGPAIFGLALAFVTVRLGWGAAAILHVGVDVVAFGAEVLLRDPGNVAVFALFAALVALNVGAFVVYGLEPLKRLLPWSKERAKLPLTGSSGSSP